MLLDKFDIYVFFNSFDLIYFIVFSFSSFARAVLCLLCRELCKTDKKSDIV